MAACAVDAMGPLGPDRPRLNKQRLAAVFRLHFSALSPSKREKAGITTDDLLTVAEAVRGGAPAPEARPAGRRASSHARSPKPEARSPKPGVRPAVEAVKAAPRMAEGCVMLKPVTDQVVKRAIDMLDARWGRAGWRSCSTWMRTAC